MNKVNGSFLEKESITIGNIVLLISVFSLIFLVPLFPRESHSLLFNSLYTIIFLMTVLALGKFRKMLLVSAILLTLIEWFAWGLDMVYLTGFSRITLLVFFIFVVIRLIFQIAGAREVNLNVILESINGYLLLGMVFSIMVAFVFLLSPDAYKFPAEFDSIAGSTPDFSKILYYSFVTFTTLGYGDIVPVKPFARSLAVLTSVSGQIYIAVIIAMLVGKYASRGETR